MSAWSTKFSSFQPRKMVLRPTVLKRSILCKPGELGGIASGITNMALYEGGKYDPDNPTSLTS